jgi:hypothetical protein
VIESTAGDALHTALVLADEAVATLMAHGVVCP